MHVRGVSVMAVGTYSRYGRPFGTVKPDLSTEARADKKREWDALPKYESTTRKPKLDRLIASLSEQSKRKMKLAAVKEAREQAKKRTYMELLDAAIERAKAGVK
jgi:hypothetical protein